MATLGIAIYELRNSQLYEAAIHRATILETKLGVLRATKQCGAAGLFSERPPYVKHESWKDLSPVEWRRQKEDKTIPLMKFGLVEVKHDKGLALIYGAALGGWAYLTADALLSVPALSTFWPRTRIIAALIAFAAFVYFVKRFMSHDKKRFRPEAPDN